MILLWAVILGLLAASIRAWVGRHRLMPPNLRLVWLVPIAFLPQLFAFYLPATRSIWADSVVAVGLITSQMLLLAFAWLNRRQPGFWLLGLGLTLNLLVIILNGGLMPVSPETLNKLFPDAEHNAWEVGRRFARTKEIVLPMVETRLWILSDHFYVFWPKRVAFSIGDVLIAAGTFWLFWMMGGPKQLSSPMLRFLRLLRQN